MSRLSKIKFSDIHQHILESRSVTAETKALGVNKYTLQTYLIAFSHKDARLSYVQLKKITPEDMRTLHGNYDTPWVNGRVKLSDYNFSDIHQHILEGTSVSAAANALGVSEITLKIYLGAFLHNDIGLSYAKLKKMSVDDMSICYGQPTYESPWEKPKDYFGKKKALSTESPAKKRRLADRALETSSLLPALDMIDDDLGFLGEIWSPTETPSSTAMTQEEILSLTLPPLTPTIRSDALTRVEISAEERTPSLMPLSSSDVINTFSFFASTTSPPTQTKESMSENFEEAASFLDGLMKSISGSGA